MTPPDAEGDLADPGDLAARIVTWYRAAARDLPWRRDPSPYHVLLSELMLQQTRVETVVPYFERFVSRWPTVQDLAAAEDDDVLAAWSGLGYYARARNLVRCARAVGAGALPDTVDGLRALPGVGPYTAGAVASIAFGVATPLVDGNVERVLSRIDARDADPKGQGRAALWDRAAALVAARPAEAHPGELNQGLMELGATVCTPRAPRCDRCPVASTCRGHASGRPEAWPTRSSKAPPRPMRGVRLIVQRQDHVLLGRRPPGLLGGLWEPVGADWDGEQGDDDARLRAAVGARTGAVVVDPVRVGEVTHVFTHRRLVCGVWCGRVAGEVGAVEHYTEVRWARPDDLPLSTLSKRVLALRADGIPLALPFAAEPDGGPG